MRFLFFTPVVFLFYAGICFYIGARLFAFIRHFLPNVNAVAFWLPFGLLCCALVFVNFLRHNLHFLRQAGSFWMAILLYMLLLLVMFDFVKLLLFLFGKSFKNYRTYTVGASLLLCALLIVFGVLHARSIKTVNYRLTLPGNGGGIRIVLVSDLHIGSSIGKPWIERVVDTINLEEPDIVCISGDIFDGNLDIVRDLPGVISQLGKIDAPLGVYASLGNHDVDRTRGSTERIEEILKAAGILLLQDDVHTVRENLHIAGRRDARPIGMRAGRKSAEELCAGLSGTVIMLDHQPTQFTQIEQAGAGLVLCGHTHSGQIFPANLATRIIFKKAGATHYGYWKGETLQAVVTSGAGFWGPPLRIATNSEVAVIDVDFMP